MIAALQEISVLEVVAAWLRESPGLYSLDMPTPSGTSGLHAGLFPRVCHKWSEDMNDCRGPSDTACCIQNKPATTYKLCNETQSGKSEESGDTIRGTGKGLAPST